MDSPTMPARRWRQVRWWWHGRNWKLFLRAAPAVLAGLGILVLAGAGLATSRRDIEARYLAEAKGAFQAKDYARALTCYERLAPTADDQPEVLYRLALSAEAAGDNRRAVSLMRALAPDDKRGYSPAHSWWARQILLSAPSSPRAFAAAEVHLVRALDGELEDREAIHGLLGQIYLSTGRLEDAELHLGKAAATRPLFRLSLARVHVLRGNPGRARQEAELVARQFRDRAKADLNNHQARLAWADAMTYLEDFPAAVRILEEGLTGTGAAVYAVALARVYVAWFDTRKKQPGTPPSELLGLVDKGLTHDPANKELLNRLLDQLRVAGPDAELARTKLRGMLAAGGTAVAPIHFALAIDARLRGDTADEKLHLERAFQADPKTGLIANNLAWVLLHQPEPDLPRALALVGTALEREPNNPTYLDTRGRIYQAMGRWKDALADLEAVLARAPKTDGLHAALAGVYEKLGQPALAAEHRRLAAEPPAPKP